MPWKTIENPPQVVVKDGPPQAQQPGVVRTYHGTGVVTIVNRKEGWVEINHEEIVGLMPAMQMEWFVKPTSLMKSIRVGDKVNFAVEDNNGSEFITELNKVPTTRQ